MNEERASEQVFVKSEIMAIRIPPLRLLFGTKIDETLHTIIVVALGKIRITYRGRYR